MEEDPRRLITKRIHIAKTNCFQREAHSNAITGHFVANFESFTNDFQNWLQVNETKVNSITNKLNKTQHTWPLTAYL